MKKLILILSAACFLCACGSQFGTGKSSAPKEKLVKSFSYDGVKRIDAGMSGQDERSFKQPQYPVNSTSRLLIRFESFRSSKGSVSLAKDDDVWLRITVVSDTDYETALKEFQLCPLIRGDWMMLASWKSAHPFGKPGRWANLGSDYDAGGCVKGVKTMIANDPNVETKEDQNAIYFKITRWFKDYLLSRNVNYGHVLIGNTNINIYGDDSGSYNPRVLWSEEVE